MGLFRKDSEPDDDADFPQDVEDRADRNYLDEADQERIRKKRSQKELARALTALNYHRVLSLVLGLGFVVAGYGWHQADERFANNVRVAWVKLQPNGQTQVEYWDDATTPNRFFEAALNASIMNYVEHRHRQIRETISADYGYVLPFMGDELATQFLAKDGFNAVKVAAECEGNPACPRIEVTVRAIVHDTMNTPDRNNAETGTFETNVYITLKITHPGAQPEYQNKIDKLIWQMRPVDEIPSPAVRPDFLKVNPLGMKIVTESVIDDVVQGTAAK